MSDHLKSQAESLFTKLKSHHFIPVAFISSTELFLSRQDQPVTYKSLSASGRSENFQAFQSTLTEEEKESIELDFNFTPYPGEVCPDLPVKIIENQEERIFHFSEEDLKVYLVEFLAIWRGNCQEFIKKNQEMMEKNPGWEGKAEIIEIFLDQDIENVFKIVDEMGLRKDCCFWAGSKGFGEVAPKRFNVQGTPTCALVFKSKVIWVGHPSERKLEEDINLVIEGYDIEVNDGVPAEVSPVQDYTPEVHIEMLSKAQSKRIEFSKKHPHLKVPDIISLHTLKIEIGKDLLSSYTFHIIGEFLLKYQIAGEEITKELSEIFPNAYNRVYFSETVTITRGETCTLCNKSLDTSQVQYLCIFCEPAHYHCESCQVQEREGVASAKLAHPHSLYRIGPESENLDEIRFGKSEFHYSRIYDYEPDRNHYRVECDNKKDSVTGCQGIVVGVRFKCVHCIDYDFCERCFGKWCNYPDPSMVQTAKNMGHLKSHVWAVIPFPF